MGATVEADGDFLFANANVGGHVDEVAEDLAGLRVSIATHLVRDGAVESAGESEEGHIEVDLQTRCRREGIDVEEAHCVGQGVFDEHALGVARQQRLGRGVMLVGGQDGRILMAEILNENLPQEAAGQRHFLFDVSGRTVRSAD